jgi:hypothetical protein
MRLPSFLFAGAVAVGAAIWLFVRSRPAYKQKSDEVVVRECGERLLGPPQPAFSEATKEIDFAWLAESAYQRTPDAEKRLGPPGCQGADNALRQRGWKTWNEATGAHFPSDSVQKRFDHYHLRVETWVNRSQEAVAVTFGGTVFNNKNDWLSNFRWFIPMHNDEYTETVHKFVPAFTKEFLAEKAKSDSFLNGASLYSVGHSLGAGLAEEFAYSLSPSDVPRVKHVYAFDPTPVSGFTSVDRATRDLNKKGLQIDRIYERGEVLAILRSLTNFFWKPPGVNPAIRQVRYNLFPHVNPISGHSMTQLACRLDEIVSGSGH